MSFMEPRTPYRPPPDALRTRATYWYWRKAGRRRSVLAAKPYEDPRTLEAKLKRAEVAFLSDEIDVDDFERLVEAALRDEEEPPPPGFRVVRNGQYVGLRPLEAAGHAYDPLPLERGL